MRNGWTLGRIAGIEVTLHWTFGLLVAYVTFASLSQGAGLMGALVEVGFLAGAFGCVVLHELGHALAARGFGIRTHGITLLPIGGVANLEAIPSNPFQELVITVAGPMVNVAIAVLLLPIVALFAGFESTMAVNVFGGAFAQRMLAFNIVMILFNLLPAFPMDGGRILRSALAFRRPYLQATERAVSISRVMALMFLVAGFFWNPFLILIAGFVYVAGGAELARLRAMMPPPVRYPTTWSEEAHSRGPAGRTVLPTIYVVPGPDGEPSHWVIRQ